MVSAQRRPVKFPEETVGQAWMLEADVQALAAQMRQAFEQPERAREMGRRGAERIAQDFTWKRAAEIAHDTLMELCRPHIRSEDGIPLSNL
ncbi:MAG: glycosyltransferase, partial [Candidatus Latescibacterota bacterium]|nr:glycosyltransferase [Candidatus Latescibacterota bacterium]